MNNPMVARVSVIEPVTQAIEKTKEILFRPFDLGKWFMIGFCAWLATMGEKGVGSGFNTGGPRHGNNGDFHSWLNEAKLFLTNNLPVIATTAVTVILVVIVLWLLITWLKGRGKFMFLYCVASNKSEVAIPWKKYRQQGNSLFGFYLVLDILCILAFVPLAVIGVVTIIPLVMHKTIFTVVGIGLSAVLLFMVLFLAIVFALIRKLANDFVVPIMFLRGCSCTKAWREFWNMLKANMGRFTLYILFQIIISLILSAIIIAALFVTFVTCCFCCCLLILLVIPYIGTVVTLPLIMFKRSYSLYYLAQYGPGYNVFIPMAEPSSQPEPVQ